MELGRKKLERLFNATFARVHPGLLATFSPYISLHRKIFGINFNSHYAFLHISDHHTHVQTNKVTAGNMHLVPIVQNIGFGGTNIYHKKSIPLKTTTLCQIKLL